MHFEPELATKRQRDFLSHILGDGAYAKIQTMSKREAHQVIEQYCADREQNPQKWRTDTPTERQETFLRKCGQWKPGLTRGEAFDLIASIKQRIAQTSPREIKEEQARAQCSVSSCDEIAK